MIKNLTTHFIEEKDGKLFFDNVSYSELLDRYSTPLFIILPNVINENISMLKKAVSEFFPKNEIFYSLKTNYHPAVLKTIMHNNIGVELVSPFEMNIALNYWSDLSYSLYGGLFKSPEHILFAVTHNVKYISVESLNELSRIDKAAKEVGRTQNILIRIKSTNNQYLGVDVKNHIETLNTLLTQHTNIRLSGFHIHTPTKKTFHKEFASRIEEVLDILSFLESRTNLNSLTLDLGGGLPESSTIHEDALTKLFSDIKEIISDRGYSPNEITLILEPGRFIVGNAGIYLSRIIDLRVIQNKRWLVLDVGTHQIPKFGKGELRFFVASDVISSYNTSFSIVGPLPTESDILRKNYNLPSHVNVGDCIAILNAGAYTMSLWREFCTARPHVISVYNGTITDYE